MRIALEIHRHKTLAHGKISHKGYRGTAPSHLYTSVQLHLMFELITVDRLIAVSDKKQIPPRVAVETHLLQVHTTLHVEFPNGLHFTDVEHRKIPSRADAKQPELAAKFQTPDRPLRHHLQLACLLARVQSVDTEGPVVMSAEDHTPGLF